MKDLFLEHISKSIISNWNIPALADFHGKSYTYGQLAEKIARLHLLYKELGVKPGDKVALCAKNSADWAAMFLSGLTYGAVVVPLLH